METRSMKRLKMSVVEDEGPSLKAAREYYLPPEIMDIIIEFLIDDMSDLMQYRLVNSYWKAVVESYIKRKILRDWRSWDNGLWWGVIDTCATHLVPFPVFPTVSAGSVSVFYPPQLDDLGKNPFSTTESLTISSMTAKSTDCREEIFHLWKKMRVEKLLCTFGQHLTSLELGYTFVTFPQLERIMASLLKLKVFNIFRVTLRKNAKNKVGSQTSLVSVHLTHVQALAVSPQIIQWLVDRCAHQLISLDVHASALKPFRQPTTPSSSPVPYQKLKYLKLKNPSRFFLQSTEFFPLKYLSVISEKRRRFENDTSLRDIVKFAGQFSKTLVELSIYLDWMVVRCKPEDWKVDDESDWRFLKKSPKLGQFGIRFPMWLRENLYEYLQPCLSKFKRRSDITVENDGHLIHIYKRGWHYFNSEKL